MRVPDNVIEALRGSHRLGIFFYLDTAPEPMRLWLGINDIPAGIDSVDPDTNQRYVGGGVLQDIPNLEAVINGVADRADFTLSGLDPAEVARTDLDAIDVRGKDFYVGITTLDDDHQPMSSIIPLITGRASYQTEHMPPVGPEDPITVTRGISVGFGITTRDRQSQALWSSVHHRAAHPDDAFCDGTSRLERGVSPSWPRF